MHTIVSQPKSVLKHFEGELSKDLMSALQRVAALNPVPKDFDQYRLLTRSGPLGPFAI
jgi:hypothetical protein